MKDAISTFTGKKLGATFFRGTKPIDGVWHTPDVIVTGACVMPAGYGVGDHRLFVIDFLTSSLVGLSPPCIVRSQARRLNTKIPRAGEKYVEKFENNIIQHNIVQRLGAAHESSTIKWIFRGRVDKFIVTSINANMLNKFIRACSICKANKITFF